MNGEETMTPEEERIIDRAIHSNGRVSEYDFGRQEYRAYLEEPYGPPRWLALAFAALYGAMVTTAVFCIYLIW